MPKARQKCETNSLFATAQRLDLQIMKFIVRCRKRWKNENISPSLPSPSPSGWHDVNPRLISGCSKLCAKISSLPGQNLHLQHLKPSKYERQSAFLMSTRLTAAIVSLFHFRWPCFSKLCFNSSTVTWHFCCIATCVFYESAAKMPTVELLKRKDRQA